MKKYFPESKTAEGKREISSFYQFPNESLSEALDRFRGLLRKTPTHGYSESVQLNIFIDGLRPQSKQLLDASVGGKNKLKTPEEAMELIENMAASDHAILCDRTYVPTIRSPDRDPQQASTATTSGKSFSLFYYAGKGMSHMWRNT